MQFQKMRRIAQNQQERDSADAANTYNSILTGTMDSNIVVLGVYAFGELPSSLNELWLGGF